MTWLGEFALNVSFDCSVSKVGRGMMDETNFFSLFAVTFSLPQLLDQTCLPGKENTNDINIPRKKRGDSIHQAGFKTAEPSENKLCVRTFP